VGEYNNYQNQDFNIYWDKGIVMDGQTNGFFVGSYTINILYLYCSVLLERTFKNLDILGLFPSLDSFGCWWDSGLVALEVALLHRHLKALHISAVTRIGALQQQVLGLHLPKQRPHMLRRDILSAQLLDHWITIPLDKYDVPPFKPKTSQNPIGKTHVLPTSPCTIFITSPETPGPSISW
jgi:hypothetical protein